MLTSDQLRCIFPRTENVISIWLGVLNTKLEPAGIEGEGLIAFLANASIETSGLSILEENLNYSITGLEKIFPSHFPKGSQESAIYAHHPERIANRVYANKLGNGEEKSGDGWRYRGRGIFQITGKANYTEVADALNLGLADNPDMLLTPAYAVDSATWFWAKHSLSGEHLSDICRTIHGSLNDFDRRRTEYERISNILKG